MYDPNLYETDEEFEQALYAAFDREPAPHTLIVRVEQRLLAGRRVPAVPTFGLLRVSTRSAWSSLWSIAAHAAVFALVALLLLQGRRGSVLKIQAALTQIDVKPFLPIASPDSAGGGGGGGAHDILQTPKGKLPKFEQQPITPPMVSRNDHPRLAQEAAIVMPKDLQLPNNDLPNLGDPRTSVAGPASNGTGAMAGMGTGAGGGIGSGRGNGYGPGEGGGYGGGLYHVGGGVAAPQLIFSVDPEFSDEARRAKFQGVCVVSLVVDEQGNPQRVQVVRHLGMGLDQKAVAAVMQYRFKPATLQGRPVAVEVNIEVNFRIY
jgi:periplasmic protein TonB